MVKMASFVVTVEEALLVDYIITLHSYDYGYLEVLKTPLFTDLRKKVSNIIAENKEALITFNEAEVEHLLITVPTTFRFAKDNCGYTFKVKLFQSQIPQPIRFFEIKPEETTDATKPTTDHNTPPSDGGTQTPAPPNDNNSPSVSPAPDNYNSDSDYPEG